MTLFGFDRKDISFIFSMFRINVSDRYLGSVLGIAWAVINPLLMFSIFIFVFTYIFKTRLSGSNSTMSYAIWMICGYAPWLANTESLTSASYSIISNAGLVKNLSFKTEILPISASFIGFIPLCVGFSVLLPLMLIDGVKLNWTLIWIPLVVVIHFLFLASMGLILAIVTTFLRDFGILLPNILTILLYATPIFYPIESLPVFAQNITELNPFYIISNSYRSVLMKDQIPNILTLTLLATFSVLILLISLALFRRIKGLLPLVL